MTAFPGLEFYFFKAKRTLLSVWEGQWERSSVMIEVQDGATNSAHGAVLEGLVPEAIQGVDWCQMLIQEELQVLQWPVIGTAGLLEFLVFLLLLSKFFLWLFTNNISQCSPIQVQPIQDPLGLTDPDVQLSPGLRVFGHCFKYAPFYSPSGIPRMKYSLSLCPIIHISFLHFFSFFFLFAALIE